MNRAEPPLASPFGGEMLLTPSVDGVSLSYRPLSGTSAARMTAKCMVCAPITAVQTLLLFPLAPFIFLVAWLFTWAGAWMRGPAIITLERDALREHAKFLSFSITWPRVLRVLEWGGDVLCVTLGGGCFVPREAFASRNEAREFASIARELKATKGQGWRDEWNGRVFGVRTEEKISPNFS